MCFDVYFCALYDKIQTSSVVDSKGLQAFRFAAQRDSSESYISAFTTPNLDFRWYIERHFARYVPYFAEYVPISAQKYVFSTFYLRFWEAKNVFST